jgi:hypothetical protein
MYIRGHMGGGSGSGSGSGSGGTVEWMDSGNGALPKIEAWMGNWNGTVYSFTSNWRELKMEEVVSNELRGRMVCYFTDNEVAYNICKKDSSNILSLHMLVQQLKTLELALECHLEVIHVPGTTMITQGADGLIEGYGIMVSTLTPSPCSEGFPSCFAIFIFD